MMTAQRQRIPQLQHSPSSPSPLLTTVASQAKPGLSSDQTSVPAHSKDSLALLKSGIAGGLAGCVAKTMVSPFDRVKILFQTGSSHYSTYSGTALGVFRAIGAIWYDSGIRGLLQGHSATLLRIFPYAGIKFMAYDTFQQILMPRSSQETPQLRFLSGAASGTTAVFLTYPLELVRVRLAIETRSSAHEKVTLKDTVKTVYREGPVGPSSKSYFWDSFVFKTFPVAKFYRGFAPTICGMVPYAGTSFLVWGTLQSKLKAWHPEQSHSVLLNLLCGSLAGLISQTASYPFEVVRRKIQVSGKHHYPLPSHPFPCSPSLVIQPNRTILETAQSIYRNNGMKGFFVGLSIGYIKVIPMTATSFFMWSTLKTYFN